MTTTLSDLEIDQDEAEESYVELVKAVADGDSPDRAEAAATLVAAGRDRADLQDDADLLRRRREASFNVDSDDGPMRLSACRFLRTTADPAIERQLDELRGRRQWLVGEAKHCEIQFRAIADLENKIAAAKADLEAAVIGNRGTSLERERISKLSSSLDKARYDASRGAVVAKEIRELDAKMAEVEREKLDPEKMRWSSR